MSAGPADAATSHPVVAVVGATATGKSTLALELAQRLATDAGPGEIINADAMQLYNGMDIGTAKLSRHERRGIPHHLLDVLEVTDEASVAAYQHHARVAICEVRARGRVPVVVGGSGLYVRAALDRLEIPPTDPAVRASFEALLARIGVERLYALLTDRDPVAARAIEPRNTRRIVRALEVIEVTGRPFSATMPRREYLEATVTIGVRRARGELDARVDARVQQMWRDGLLEEVRELVPRGLRQGRTAAKAIGYEQALAQLDGELTQDAAIAATQLATRRFVRRQESWFGRDDRTVWLDATEVADAGAGQSRLADVAIRAIERSTAVVGDNGAHD